MKDIVDILTEYTDQAGIVVPFPQTTEQHAEAIIEYVSMIENELNLAETLNDNLKAEILALRRQVASLESQLEIVRQDDIKEFRKNSK